MKQVIRFGERAGNSKPLLHPSRFNPSSREKVGHVWVTRVTSYRHLETGNHQRLPLPPLIDMMNALGFMRAFEFPIRERLETTPSFESIPRTPSLLVERGQLPMNRREIGLFERELLERSQQLAFIAR